MLFFFTSVHWYIGDSTMWPNTQKSALHIHPALKHKPSPPVPHSCLIVSSALVIGLCLLVSH